MDDRWRQWRLETLAALLLLATIFVTILLLVGVLSGVTYVVLAISLASASTYLAFYAWLLKH